MSGQEGTTDRQTMNGLMMVEGEGRMKNGGMEWNWKRLNLYERATISPVTVHDFSEPQKRANEWNDVNNEEEEEEDDYNDDDDSNTNSW